MTPEERFERIENAVRDLTGVSRTILDAQQRTGANIDALAEHEQAIDEKLLQFGEKLNVLADTVQKLSLKIDSLIRRIQKPNGQE